MNGIYIINEKMNLKGLSEKHSFELQKEILSSFIRSQKIQIAKLNPYQLHEHYTIPHALYYDLKKEKIQLDCLIMYSLKVIEDYVSTYPARWLMLKSFFQTVITIEHHAEQWQVNDTKNTDNI